MSAASAPVPTLTASAAAALDEELMAQPGFSLDQLMELAGLSVAAAVEKHFPLDSHPRVLAVCGPGNNGGDGLVAARHLHHFGRQVTVVLPKRNTRVPIFNNLVTQLEQLNVPVLDALPEPADLPKRYDVIIDAVFGFSFAGAVRPPFDSILGALRETSVPVASVDVPSGWDVDKGDVGNVGVRPAVLISLTAPKGCSASFGGAHYLGGRFVPPGIVAKYSLEGLPPYPGAEQVVRLR
jgi:NAD(P)H-hydrate epimerase